MNKDNRPQNQQEMFESDRSENRDLGPVTCLGMTFENHEKRREYFLEKLHEKLKDPEFRKTEGFPIGEDEDILALSDPPYHTACPNPFIEDFIKHHGRAYDSRESYSREPFATDVSEGKNDRIYNAHSYHTKVPHKAIMRYILHYTEPGDIVFDGFCGTGMTGVAAQLCGNEEILTSLGYSQEERNVGLGARNAILCELSPGASFIAHNFNIEKNATTDRAQIASALAELEEECSWMYETQHTGWPAKERKVRSFSSKNPAKNRKQGHINYIVWSDVFLCTECNEEIILWYVAADENRGGIRDVFECPSCGAQLSKREMSRVWIKKFDSDIGEVIAEAKRVPVLIDYQFGGKNYQKNPDEEDLNLIREIEELSIPYWYPVNSLHDGDKTSDPKSVGVTHAHHFHTRRSLYVLAKAWHMLRPLGAAGSFVFSSTLPWATRQNRLLVSNYFKKRGDVIGQTLSGTLYISSIGVETNVLYRLKLRASSASHTASGTSVLTSTQSSTNLSQIEGNSIDYIFTDPPFGHNLVYSDLNYLLESWVGVRTQTREEAIVSRSQGKKLFDYERLIGRCFKELYRVLKPGRWITVEFHNSKNSVWMAIQLALGHAGFVVANVSALEKTHGTFNQVTAAGAVKKDLAITAYKPNDGLEKRFELTAGTEDGVWDFVRTHLKHLPVFVSKNSHAEFIAERQHFLLFDRMVAFHVQRGVTVPMSAAEFYAGLEQRFPPRDGMYFLPAQAAEYDKKRMTVEDVLQLQLFVTDEASAIQWLKQQLTKKPQTFQDIHPQFLKEIGGWQKYEKALELSELLEQNFIRYDGKDEVPSQIHSYLSSNFKELRNLEKHDPALKAKAKDRWYVPDPKKAGDLEKLRERALLREFEEYRNRKKKFKRNEKFRMEAVRAGFKKAWQERDYVAIIAVARKIPEKILQEDPKLLMWYDQAVTRTGDEK